jgi:hypothetical protein
VKMRVAASVAVTVLVSAALAGCQFVTPQQTARSYTPSDGVNGSAGPVAIRNALLITGSGETASLIGVLTNSSDSAQTVSLEWTSSSGTETERVAVPAGGLLSLSTDSGTVDTSTTDETDSVVLEDVEATPGGLFRMSFTSGSDSTDLQLPVLTGKLQEYSTLVPTVTPTPTRTPRRTESPAPTDSSTPTPTDTLAG